MTNQLTNTNGRKGYLAVGILIIVVVTIVAWVPFSVSSSGKMADVDLDGSHWTLVSINGEPIVAGSEVTAEFAEGQIAGTAGVNRYFAGYEAESEALTIGPAGSTMMMGPEDLMGQEMTFLSALGTAGSFHVDGDTLEIVFDGGSLLFTAVN